MCDIQITKNIEGLDRYEEDQFITVNLGNIPNFLRKSNLCNSLDPDEILSVPKKCFLKKNTIEDINDLFMMVHTLEYWSVTECGSYFKLYDFCVKYKDILKHIIDQCCEDYSIWLFEELKTIISPSFTKYNFFSNNLSVYYNKWLTSKLDPETCLFVILIKKQHGFENDFLNEDTLLNLFNRSSELEKTLLLNRISKNEDFKTLEIISKMDIKFSYDIFDKILYNSSSEMKDFLKLKFDNAKFIERPWGSFRIRRPQGISGYCSCNCAYFCLNCIGMFNVSELIGQDYYYHYFKT